MERRYAKVTLHPGNYEPQLADLMDRAVTAKRAEDSSGTKRAGTRSEANRLAREYDALLAEAEKSGVEVTVWAISYTEWSPLADEHPPREGDSTDGLHGVNMKTFPLALLKVSLVDPSAIRDVPAEQRFEALKAAGETALAALGDISRIHYAKLENAAWNVNVGDDALPKFSLVSLLREQSAQDSSSLSDSE